MARIHVSKFIKTRLPISRWLPSYTPEDAIGDLVAGLTVGLTLIPQAIAYAALAQLGAQYGLYSAFAGSLVYIALGTCREVNIGPTALTSLLTFTYARGIPEYAVLLCFLSGCVTMILGILHLGFLVQFVSTPVVAGFTSAASVIIACSQIKGLLGVKTHGEGFLEIWQELYRKINDTRMPDLILSCCCIIVLLCLKKIKDVKTSNKSLNEFFWFLGTGRNALVVIVCALASYIFEIYSKAPFILTGSVEAGLPHVEAPPFSIDHENKTINFLEMCRNLGSGIIVVPLISIIGNIAIAKAFSHGQTLDATQEMLTLGLCNIVGSFFHSMPVTGSFSRSAVNNASGVRTPLGGLYTGILVILALSLLTPYFYYIPRATLSSVIICAVIFMVEIGILEPIWKCSKRDLIPTFVTFFACLFAGVELGILIGVTMDIIIVVYFNARPTMYIEYRNTPMPSYVLVRPSAGLMFPAVDYLREHVSKSIIKNRHESPKGAKSLSMIVLDVKHVDRIDFTAIQGINAMIKDLKDRNCRLIILHPTQEILKSIQSFANDPIITAHSDFELVTILKRFEIETRSIPETRLEVVDFSNKKTRVKEDEITSTNL